MNLSSLIDQFSFSTKIANMWSYGEIVLVLLGALLVRRPLVYVIFSLLSLGKSEKQKTYLRQALAGPLELGAVAVVFYASLQFLTFVHEIFYAAKVSGSVLMIAVFWAIHRSINAYATKVQEMYTLVDVGLTREVAEFITLGLRVVVVVVAVFTVLDIWGVNLTALIGGVGIMGAAIAFASQDIIKNIFGSIVVLTDRTYQVGDFVRIENTEGVVEHIGLRTTTLRDINKSLVSIPNSAVVNATVMNITRRTHRLIEVAVTLDPETPNIAIETFVRRLRGYLATHERVACDEVGVTPPIVCVADFTDRGIAVKATFFMSPPGTLQEGHIMKESVYLKAKQIADSEDVKMAWVQRIETSA
ncbi:MAG: mechanosensitive ion channel family protein [Alphaproteobacteria bacterium]|nr:MAG: mechanosensitive ion channel family protein [Alphaproteobacteria bacterium]